MSREYHDSVRAMHEGVAKDFVNGRNRHVECRIDDSIYVYLHVDGVHIQTQHVEIPERWWDNWPSEATVRRYVHRHADIGSAPITTLDA